MAGMGAAAAVAAACGGGGNKTTSSSKPAATTAGGGAQTSGQASPSSGKQLGTVKVGSFVDRSGATANIGNLIGDATKDWVEYVNAENVIGRKTEWPEFDHSYQVDKA